MGLESRPYVGTWRLNRQQVVQHTPDCLVYLNGDTALPGCARCNSRIDIQEFITEVSVDAGTDPGATSASFTLSVPVHYHDSFAKDAQFLLRPGLEVHIYQRGFFPVVGLYPETDEKLPAYPYYHVFHGVITQVGGSYSSGVQTFSVQCGSMLHFWEYQQVSTNAAIHAKGPGLDNGKNKISDRGHNYTGQHPYEIMWHIHNDFVSAAAGIGFALSNQTNVNAMFGNKYLYSYTAKYWEERFRTSTIRLRMHGATGTLFNAAQASFLGRANSKELLKLVKSRINPSSTGSKNGPDIFSTSEIRGSWTPDTIGSLQWLDRSSSGKKNVGLNIVEMQAFITDIGMFGQYNEFESTYESKLDIANKVCGVTGFEFYQDVDGDLVFKPPFYNMDTSGSRTYRIEDIDIISINFDEKEPEATYMTAKGGQIKNTTGAGADNEYGVRGQYVDYRLVAKYGWKPGEFETSYINDKEAMQHAAANQLDILNVGVQSATLTIPLRPEIRPGFPVYIKYLDCFYYCTSMSHSFVVGGQCTTTLQLSAKRAKFFAPGDVDKPNAGIDAIRLDNPSMPPRPLQVEDNMKYPSLMGFPNIVMSLDPNRVDPRLLLMGGGVYNIKNPKMMQGILQMAIDMRVIDYAGGADSGEYFEMQVEENKTVTFHYPMDLKSQPAGTHLPTSSPTDAFDLKAGVDEYKKMMVKRNKSQETLKKAIVKGQKRVTKLAHKYMGISNDKVSEKAAALKAVQKAEKAVGALRNKYDVASAAFQTDLDALQGKDADAVKTIYKIVQELTDSKDGSREGINSTGFILDILEDKKSMLTNASIPGSYRYYSSSHPDSEHQGMPELTINLTADASEVTTLSDPSLPNPVKGEGFLKGGPQTTQNKAVDSEFGVIDVVRGIKILDGNPGIKGGVIIPTSEIRSLSFSPVHYTTKGKRTKTKEAPKATSLTSAFYANLLSSAMTVVSKATADTTLEAAFKSWLAELNETILRAAYMAYGTKVPLPEDVTFTRVQVRESVMELQDTPNVFELSGSGLLREPGKSFVSSESITVSQFWNMVARQLVNILKVQLNYYTRTWSDAVKKDQPTAVVPVAPSQVESAEVDPTDPTASVNIEDVSQSVITTFIETIQSVYGPSTSGKVQKKSGSFTKHINTSCPVFPVSDARGYEVFGAFQYGRGVDIDANGVFSQLVLEGPLQNADDKTTKNFLNTLIRNRETVEGAQLQALVTSLKEADLGNASLTSILSAAPGLEGEAGTKTQALAAELRNWYINGRDAVVKTKVQLTNAAYNLADLKPAALRICSCKMAEASIILESAQDQEFVSVVEGFAELQGKDPVTDVQIKGAAAAGVNWELHQQALRGEILDKNSGDIVSSISNLGGTYDEAKEEADRAKASLEDAKTDYETIKDKI